MVFYVQSCNLATGYCSLKVYSRRLVWVLIYVYFFIVVIVVLIIFILSHSYDAALMYGGNEIILVGKAVNEQRLIAIGHIPSITHGNCLNVLDNSGRHW